MKALPRTVPMNRKLLLLLLRERVASGYYERPEVLDVLARVMLASRLATST